MFNLIEAAENEFERCWTCPAYTQIELHPVDINRVLLNYITNKPLHFTKKMLWDMETKKAWNPGKYIPYVVEDGSATAWGKKTVDEGSIFVRKSKQKQWLDPNVYETVYEEVYVDERKKLITFLGVLTLPGRDEPLNPTQSLFHVQHGAEGDEMGPLNTWRIVHLTKEKDRKLIEHFDRFNSSTILPGFIEMYIHKDLDISCRKKKNP